MGKADQNESSGHFSHHKGKSLMDIIYWFIGPSLNFKVLRELLSLPLNRSGSTQSGLSDNNHHLIWSDLTLISSPTIQDGSSHTHYPFISETLTEPICPLWWACGRWCVDLAPAQSSAPVLPIRAQRGESDSGALAFPKQAGENEPWRKSEVIIFIISQGSSCGNGDLWGGGGGAGCTSCSISQLIGPYKRQW